MPNLTLDSIKSNPLMKAKLVHPDTGQVWSSPITMDLSMQTTANFNTPFADLMAGANDAFQTVKAAAGMVDSSFGTNLHSLAPVPSLLTPAHSIMTWSNSERPTFNIIFTFIASHEGEDVQKQAVSLAAMTLPSLDYEGAQKLGMPLVKNIQGTTNNSGSGSWNDPSGSAIVKVGETKSTLSGMLKAPAGYTPVGNDAKGTFDLFLGNWLKATKLILQDCQIEISKERFASNGNAVWATATATLVPYRNPTHNEFANWFISSGGSASSIFDTANSISNAIDAGKSIVNQASSAISDALSSIRGIF